MRSPPIRVKILSRALAGGRRHDVAVPEEAKNIAAIVLSILVSLGDEVTGLRLDQRAVVFSDLGLHLVEAALLDCFSRCHLRLTGFPISHVRSWLFGHRCDLIASSGRRQDDVTPMYRSPQGSGGTGFLRRSLSYPGVGTRSPVRTGAARCQR